MKALIASLAALGLLASPALAAQKTTKPATTKSVAKTAKAEGESTATEAKEHRAAVRHHAAAKCSCPSKYAHKMVSKKAATKKAA